MNIFLPLFGITTPLTFQNLFVGFDVFILLLFTFAWIRTKQLVIKIQIPRYSRIEKVFYALPVCFPLLAALGAIVLNNGGSDILTLVLLGAVAFYSLLLVILRDKIPTHIFPYAIFFIAIACLFTTSLRSWYITGHDIVREYYVFTLTNTHHIWNMAFYQDAYNACLSITILPTILTNLLEIQGIYVYKVIFQILFATTPVLVFFILTTYTTPLYAFLSALMFMSFPTFFNDMAMLNRQEIGFIFFGLILYMLLTPTQSQSSFPKLHAYSRAPSLLLSQLNFLKARIPKRIEQAAAKLYKHINTIHLPHLNKHTTTNTIRCPNCSDSLPTHAIFCGVCGVKLETDSTATLIDNTPKEFKVTTSPELSISMKRILLLVFALGVIVSHYSTNFVLLALLTFIYISTQITSLSFVKKGFALLISK